MRRNVVSVIITLLVSITLLLYLIRLKEPDSFKTTQAYASISFALPTSTPGSINSGGGIDWGNPTIIGAVIALLGVFAMAGVYIYQTHRNAKIEREKLEIQYQHEQELQQVQAQHEQEMLRLQKELEEQSKFKERELQRQETEAEAAQSAMLRAKSLVERVEAYRKALRTDPRIARLQILDMNRPLTVTDIFIPLRLHQETKSSYELDPVLQDAELRHDPNALLEVSQLRLENRSNTALTPEEVIRTHKHCIIVGDPGAGKSTLLKHLTLQSVEGQLMDLPDLPIHVELNAFANSGYQDVLEYASAVWEERYSFPKIEALDYMHRRLQAGKALLLLDALDETIGGVTKEQAEESYMQASKAITDLATLYHMAPIVVTARKAGYHQRMRLAGFIELEVLDFRLEDIKQFVIHWFACHPNPQKRGNAPELNTKLERNPRMQALAANPLLLSLIVIVYEDQLDLPERRAELYKQCVDTLLTKWDASRNIRRLRAFKPEHKRQLLEEVAWHFHQKGQRYFPEYELLDVIANFLPAVGLKAEQNEQALEEISAENGLLKEQARGWQGFLHLTLQEYFAAQYAVDHQQLDWLLMRRDDPWWEEVLLLFAGRTPDASLLLQQLLGLTPTNSLQDDLFYTNLILAGHCLAAFPTVRQVSLREAVISRLFQVLKTTPYSLTCEQVAATLAEIGGATVNALLVCLLSDTALDGDVRKRIARALGELGERSVAPELVRLLSDTALDKDVRGSIAMALGELGERSVAPELVRLLSDTALDGDVRESIAEALGELRERSVASELVRLLSDTSLDGDVRGSIAMALGELGERSVAPELVRLLSDTSLAVETDVMFESIQGELGYGGFDATVCAAIAYSLGELGERSVAPELVRLLSDTSLRGDVRGSIAHSLISIGDHSMARNLVKLISDKQIDDSFRSLLAYDLDALGERSVAPELVRLLSDTSLDGDVRESIAEALGKLGERSVAPELVHLLSDTSLDGDVRERIARALGELRERSVAPELVRLLSDTSLGEGVLMSIARALGELRERSVVPELVRLLSDTSLRGDVRGGVAMALGKLGERSVAPELVCLLSDTSLDGDVRESIARALGELGERSVVPHLVVLLTNEQIDKFVRQSILGAFTLLTNDEDSVRALATLLYSSDIADSIHRSLWTLSRQAGVRISISNMPEGRQVEVVKLP